MNDPTGGLWPVTLEGDRLRLEPASSDDAIDFHRATDASTFRWFGVQPSPWTVGECERFFDAMRAYNAHPLAVRLRETGELVAGSSYCDVKPTHRGVEIGWTWIAEQYRGTFVNPEMKLLMLTHAFETWGAIRVMLKTHHDNIPSQRAMEKLGAQKEGVLRNHMIMPDGSLRHSVLYSIVREEWEGVREGLVKRLA